MPTAGVLASLVRLMTGRELGARIDVAAAVAWELLGIALGVLGPLLLKLVVDALSDGGPEPAPLAILVAGFVVAWSGTSLVTSIKYAHTTRIIDRVAQRLLGAAVRAQLPLIARERSSDTSRVLGVFERLPHSLQIVVDGLLWRAAPLVVQIAVSLVLVGLLAPTRYVLLLALVLGGYLVAAHIGAGSYGARSQAANAAAGALSASVGDVLRNARRVVFNGALDREAGFLERQAGSKIAADVAAAWSLARLSALQYAVVGAGLLVLLVAAGGDVIAGRLTVGDFVLLQAYAFRLASPLSGFGYVLRQAGVCLANIADALALAAGGRSETTSTTVEKDAACIRLQGVGFRYGDGPWAVREITAAIAAGAFAAIVGPNGSGKSTLAQLIAGHLEPGEGAVIVADADLAGVSPDARHAHVLYVPQHIGLFNRSLGANALYPPSGLSVDDLIALLDAWRFYDGRRPIDLDLLVGEQGERLSGGQIQKLELARLTGVQAPAIILDESTSQLDGPSEARALATLRERLKGRTTLVIVTHRRRLAEAADQVLFLQSGRLGGAGLHAELMARNPVYARFWTSSLEGERAQAAAGA